ncbi:MAG: major facilitator superfamily 1 [Herbinix sp.]|nr:major facilitator superfamily 1 [Herbinix sp.]
MVVMPLYIIDNGGSGATVGLFSFLSLVPALLVYPFAGVLGDRMNRKKIMVLTDFGSAGAILGLAILSYFGRMNLSLLLIVQIVISLLNGLFDPATKGMLPKLVKQDELNWVNSQVASLRGVSVLLGPVIGTALYAHIGITILLFINGISFLLSGISEMLIRYKHIKRESAEGLSGIAGDLIEGIRFVMANKIIAKLCCFLLILYALAQSIFSVVFPLFFKTRLEYSDTKYGYLQSMLILGMLIGSSFVGLLFGKKTNLLKPLKVGTVSLSVTMLMLSALMFPPSISVFGRASIPYFVILAVILCAFSASIMFINVPVNSFIQRETPNEYMSRVFSIMGMISRGGIPFGALLYGVILERWEMHYTVLVAALLMMMISNVFLTSIEKAQD